MGLEDYENTNLNFCFVGLVDTIGHFYIDKTKQTYVFNSSLKKTLNKKTR